MNKVSIYAAGLLAGGLVIGLIYFQPQPIAHNQTLDEQMVTSLQGYIQINTTHPTPDYKKARLFLQKLAHADGFIYREALLPSGRTAAIISYPGTDTDAPALLLNHHIDVVPAPNESEWSAPPFAGEIKDGTIIGRGTQDMKGIGMVHYFALKSLKNSGVTPNRSIHILAIPDEEIGGFTGTKEFVQTDLFKELNIGFVIDEGHASGKSHSLDLKVSERKPIQVKVTGKGTLSHGSHLHCLNINHELVSFLKLIQEMHTTQQQKNEIPPGQLLSLNITSLTSGARKDNGTIALNVVPDAAEATIDIRVPPTIKCCEVLAQFEKMLTPFKHLTYSVLAQAKEEPELKQYKTKLYLALEKTIARNGLSVEPHFFEGASDLRFYLAKGIDGIGLTPFTVEDNIHGTNESVPIDQLIRARKITTEFLTDFCCI